MLRVGSRRSGALVVAVLLLASALVPAGAAQTGVPDETEAAFVVSLEADGAATVTLRETFDLTTADERSAFRALERNESRTDRLRTSFTQRLRGVAATAAAETERSMAIEDATVSVRSDGDTGVLALSATWTGLAATDGDRLRLSEPFDADFDTERPFVVHAPDGYALSTTEPAPDGSTDAAAAWDADTSLDGLTVVATPGATGSSGPGFGVLVAGSAVAALALFGRRRAR